MWNYKNFSFNANAIDILTAVRNVALTQGKDILRNFKILDYAIMFTCPWHKNGMERKPSCGLITHPKENGLPVGKIHCFSCGKTVDLEEFISNCFGVYDGGVYGLKWLDENFQHANINSRSYIVDSLKKSLNKNARYGNRGIEKNPKQVNYVSEEELDSYRYYHPYMFKRKLTERAIDMFDVGYDQKSECITFPIHDEYGNVLFIARRSVNQKYFNYPSAVIKPLYGVYQLKRYTQDLNEIVICESIFNCITSWIYGRPAIALNGTGSSSQLEAIYNLPYRKLVLALDPDDAGKNGERKIFKKINGTKVITRLIIPEGKDVNDLSKTEFDSLPETLITNVEQIN